MNICTNFDGNPFNSLKKKHTNEPHGDGRESRGVNNIIRIHSLGTAVHFMAMLQKVVDVFQSGPSDTAMPRAIPLAIV